MQSPLNGPQNSLTHWSVQFVHLVWLLCNFVFSVFFTTFVVPKVKATSEWHVKELKNCTCCSCGRTNLHQFALIVAVVQSVNLHLLHRNL